MSPRSCTSHSSKRNPMTDPTVAERILDAMHKATYRKGGDQQDRRKRRAAIVTTALAEERREVCSSTLAEAQALGYLDHADACRKGIDSETCTCGMMSWLPSAMGGISRRSRA